MYLPKFKITPPKYTYGEEYELTTTGEAYTGYYFTDSSGQAYSGKAPGEGDNTALKLVNTFVAEINRDRPDLTDYDVIVNDPNLFALRKTLPLPAYYPIPDPQQSAMLRYFAKEKVTGQILEISKSTYQELRRKSNLYFYPGYDILELLWIIQGSVEDTVSGSYTIPGIKSKNKKQLEQAEKTMPGISSFLTDLAQFAQ